MHDSVPTQEESYQAAIQAEGDQAEYRGWIATEACQWIEADIFFVSNQVTKSCCDPCMAHWRACKRILRYLSLTQDYRVLYSSVNPDVISKDMKNMSLPAACVALKRPGDANVSQES